MPLSGTRERVTPVLDFPSRDRLSIHALRVDHEPIVRGDAESATAYDRV
jgi:hypothetical protein